MAGLGDPHGSRGRRGTLRRARHPRTFCVAGQERRLASMLTLQARHFAWQVWHLVVSSLPLRCKGGVW